jgi:hypothetical protein
MEIGQSLLVSKDGSSQTWQHFLTYAKHFEGECNIRIRLAQLNFFLLRPDDAKSLPCWLYQFSNVRTQQKKSIGPILFLYYEESLVSSNLNSNLLRFHCAHPNVYTTVLPEQSLIL